jgi:Ca2+-transporting ATPase
MILTDDDFSTIVKAVELGRGLYDNLKKYIRFQMGCLTGFIVTFLGASIFNVVGGVPFLPLQTLYVNFTTQVAQAIGLGYGKPSEGLMERKPRPPDEQILPRDLLRWLVIAGAIMGIATLGLLWWAADAHDDRFARTMGMTSFAIANLLFSFTAKSDTESIFSLDTFDDRRFLIATGVSVAAIIIGTETRLCQRFLDTQHLDGKQWLLCIGVALPVVAASEIRKFLLRRRERGTVAPAVGD